MAIEMPEPVISVQLVIDHAMVNALAGITPAMLNANEALRSTVRLIHRVMARHEARIPATPQPEHTGEAPG